MAASSHHEAGIADSNVLVINAFVILFSMMGLLYFNECTLTALSFAVRPGWVTRVNIEAALRGFPRTRLARVDAAVGLAFSLFLSVNMFYMFISCFCFMLDHPHTSHTAWLASEGALEMERARDSAAAAIKAAQTNILSLTFMSWTALVMLTVRWLHVNSSAWHWSAAYTAIVLTRAACLRAIAQRIRDGGVDLTSAYEPRSLLGWSRLITAVDTKGRLSGADCPICLSRLSSSEELIIGSCSHTYHGACADAWETALSGERVQRRAPPPLSSPGFCGLAWQRAKPALRAENSARVAAGAHNWLKTLEQGDACSATLSSCPLCRQSRSSIFLPKRPARE